MGDTLAKVVLTRDGLHLKAGAKVIDESGQLGASSWDDLGKVEKTKLVKEKTLLLEHDFGEVTGGPGGFPYETEYPAFVVTLPVDGSWSNYPTMDFILSVNGVEHEVTAELGSKGPFSTYVVDVGDVSLMILDNANTRFTFNQAGSYNLALYHVGGEVEKTVTEIAPIPSEYLPEHLHFGKVEKVEMVAGKELLFEHDFGEITSGGPGGFPMMGYREMGEFTLPLDENGNPCPTMDFVLSVNGVEQEITAVWNSSPGPYDYPYSVDNGSIIIGIRQSSGNQFVADSYTINEAGTYNVALYHAKAVETTVVETVPMAEEYMPLLTSPNGTKYKLTVADDGTLSAVAVTE